MSALAIVFWISVGLVLYAHVGYGALLCLLARVRARPAGASTAATVLPTVSVIVAAYAEQDVIGARIANLLALEYPRERLELIVACDGSPDATAALARAAGADLVIELDVYSGALTGLLVAEVEFGSEEAAGTFEPPAWFGTEVTDDARFKNQQLASVGAPAEVERS